MDEKFLNLLKMWDKSLVVTGFTALPPEKGEYKGYKWEINNNGVGTTAYVQIPKGHKLYTEEGFMGNRDIEFPDIPANGGASFYEYLPEDAYGPNDTECLPPGCWVGWDYMHYCNLARVLTREMVVKEIKDVIEWFIKENGDGDTKK